MTIPIVPDPTSETVVNARAAVILQELDLWLRGAPEREIRMSYSLESGFRVVLKENHISHGDTLLDATSQVATVLLLDQGVL
jgi:hypothetical protein